MGKPTRREPMRKKLGASKKRGQEQLGYAGLELFDWCVDNFDNVESVKPLLIELCVLSDRLSEIRAALAQGLDPRLVNSEIKVASQYSKVWRLLGLSDDPRKTGRVGRPMGVPNPTPLHREVRG